MPNQKSPAILLAAYGALRPRSVKTITDIRDRVVGKYPDSACLVAYTSTALMEKMAGHGQHPLSVSQGLEDLISTGNTTIVIQSLHMIPGEEYHEVLATAQEFRKSHPQKPVIEIGPPLLAGEEALKLVAERILSVIPETSGKNEAVVLMGHGTKHPGNEFYVALNKYLGRLAGHVYLGTLEADPGIDHIQDRLAENKVTKVFLMPFLFGAGVHATRDLSGDKSGSWKTTLSEMGIECETVMKGVGEYGKFIEIWLDNLDKAMSRAKSEA